MAITASRTSGHVDPSDVTETMTPDSSLAWVITRRAVITPSTTASAMNPRVLRAKRSSRGSKQWLHDGPS